MNPGYNEDIEGRPFSPNGAAGRIFHRAYLPGVNLPAHACIFISNAVRCPSPRTNPSPAHYTCCFPLHSAHDIPLLARISRLLVVCLGAASVSCLHSHFATSKTKIKLRDAFSRPLSPYPLPGGGAFQLLATFHPAYLARDRNHIHAVSDHMALVRSWCQGTLPAATVPQIQPPRTPRSEARP